MRGRLKKKKLAQSQHPIDIMLDISLKIAKKQGLIVDVKSFSAAKRKCH